MGSGTGYIDIIEMERHRCPHCLENSIFESQVDASATAVSINDDPFDPNFETERTYTVMFWKCRLCGRPVVWLKHMTCEADRHLELIYPVRSEHPPVPCSVPEELRKIYEETCRVSRVSGTATVIMIRRAIQHAARLTGLSGTSSNLMQQIQNMKDSLSPQTFSCLDALRNLGNAGAHPKDDSTDGGVISISSDEAAFAVGVLYDILVDLFERPRKAEEITQLADIKRSH